MTVQELINELQQLCPDLQVCIAGEGKNNTGSLPIHEIKVENSGGLEVVIHPWVNK